MPTAENHLIELLPRKDRRRLLSLAEDVTLTTSEVLGREGEPTRYVYFPVDGFISLVTSLDGKPVLEVGMVGREGMFGAQLCLNVPTQALHAVVQGPGHARRMASSVFGRELKQSAALQATLSRYLYVLMGQLAASAACVRFHPIDARLGRWLLMMQDRAHADSFHVTHEFLAFMLGVRRVGITLAAGTLHRRGLIEYKRGRVTILDRKRLQAATCSCYAADRQTYARIMH